MPLDDDVERECRHSPSPQLLASQAVSPSHGSSGRLLPRGPRAKGRSLNGREAPANRGLSFLSVPELLIGYGVLDWTPLSIARSEFSL